MGRRWVATEARRTTTGLRLPPELWEAIKAEAAKQHISANSLMVRILEKEIPVDWVEVRDGEGKVVKRL